MPHVAVVTGSAQNLGAAIALHLAERGFSVVINARSKVREAQAVANQARALGVEALAVQADVTDAGAVEMMLNEATELGAVRALVNNAAHRPVRPLAELDLAEWRAVHAVVAEGAFNCIQAALPHMRQAGGGRVVNILGGRAIEGDPDRVHLSAAKSALVGLTLAAAKACVRDRITVNAVSPHAMRTTDEADLRRRRVRVAQVVGLLASEDASAVTGQIISVYGDEMAFAGDLEGDRQQLGGHGDSF